MAAGVPVRAPEEATIYKGRAQQGMCLAPDEIQAAAAFAEANGIPVQQAACDDCPVRATCKWLAQFADQTHGLKIVVRQALGSNAIPGLPRDLEGRNKQAAKDYPPILGIAFDEGLGDSLDITMATTIGDCSAY